MDLELKGRVAVVTGCSVGIGREIAGVMDARFGDAVGRVARAVR
jgi:NAD(P)-dependent dehydrogenase (short-subunit alcohol dehydrogenase family)